MIHFRDRNDIIEWAEQNLPPQYRAVARAFRRGSIEFLGGFSHVDPYIHKPGWVIKITSEFKKVYYIAVLPRYITELMMKHQRPHSILVNEPPWEHWDGDKSDNPLYQGDNPEKYKELKNGCTKQGPN